MLSKPEQSMMRALAFGPMRQSALRDSSGYSLNTVKQALRNLAEKRLVAKHEGTNPQRFVYTLNEHHQMARQYRDIFIDEYESSAPAKVRRRPMEVLSRMDQLLSLVRTIRRTSA